MKKFPWWIVGLMLALSTSFIVLLVMIVAMVSPSRSPASPPRPTLPIELTAGELRFRAIEKRLLDLESATGDISFRMRLERRVNNEESQRRVDEIVARANASRDAGRDR